MENQVAADYKGDVMFVLVTTDEAEHKRVIDFFGIKEEVTFPKMLLPVKVLEKNTDHRISLPLLTNTIIIIKKIRSFQQCGSQQARRTW